MRFIPTCIPEVIIIESQVFEDNRGFLMETYHQAKFQEGSILPVFVQDNHSTSRQGVLRGLHYQVVKIQGKLIRVVIGEIYDVAVDLRRSSPTFGQWVGTILSVANKNQLWIPPGFAHGFYVLSPWADVIYKMTDYYAPQHERSLRWDDPQVGIQWPLLHPDHPYLSPRDASARLFRDIPVDEFFM